MSELEKAAYALLGGLITFLFTSFGKWILDRGERKRIKTAEFFSALSRYVDYLLTVTFYPQVYVKENHRQMLLHLEDLKSQLIDSQCLLVAFNYARFLETKPLTADAIAIDSEFTSLIFTSFTTDQLHLLNDKAYGILKRIHEAVENCPIK